MKVRAVIVDVYHTLMEIEPPPASAAEQWEFLWEDKLADPARLSLAEFADTCRGIIEREHALARSHGIAYPEIFWPAVAREALPELAHLEPDQLDDFLYRHAQLQRTVKLMPGAGEVLEKLVERKIALGIASNAQPYTLRELDSALAEENLPRSLFDPEICFWSFACGFSKPDPHVFRLLAARLRVRGVAPGETLMIGDRLDNDIEPARAQGWQVWQLTPPGCHPGAAADTGNWNDLARHLAL